MHGGAGGGVGGGLGAGPKDPWEVIFNLYFLFSKFYVFIFAISLFFMSPYMLRDLAIILKTL